MLIAKKAILVEGPSDELFVQWAYKEIYGKLPINDGIDVISVRGLSFKRFLEIANIIKKEVISLQIMMEIILKTLKKNTKNI